MMPYLYIYASNGYSWFVYNQAGERCKLILSVDDDVYLQYSNQLCHLIVLICDNNDNKHCRIA